MFILRTKTLTSLQILNVKWIFFSEKNIYMHIYAYLYTPYFIFYVSKSGNIRDFPSIWKGTTCELLHHTFQNSRLCFNFNLVPEITCASVCSVQSKRHSQDPVIRKEVQEQVTAWKRYYLAQARKFSWSLADSMPFNTLYKYLGSRNAVHKNQSSCRGLTPVGN